MIRSTPARLVGSATGGRRSLRSLLAVLALAGLVLSATLTGAAAPAAPTSQPRMFAYYYLWWSSAHWREKLGSHYAYGSQPLPLPATLDSTGCGARSSFTGNQLTDVPAQLWTQDDRATIERDVRQAMAAGLTGFAVNWAGTGAANQTPNSVSYSRRLDTLVRVVNQVRSEGHTFSLWISYKSSAQKASTTTIANDLTYLNHTYGANPAFDRSNGNRPTLILMGSRKYGTSELATISRVARPHFYFVGDETPGSWTPARAAFLDGDHYYWSSQNPVANPQSFGQLATLANAVRAQHNPDGSRKGWFAPLAPGYNKEIGGGRSCVPRRGGQTLRDLYAGNARTAPDAWLLISWNEITEGTYVVPLQRYGSQSLDALRAIGRVAG
jgi:hypothetical protein